MKYDSIAKKDKTRSDESKTYKEQGNMKIVASRRIMPRVKQGRLQVTIMDKE